MNENIPQSGTLDSYPPVQLDLEAISGGGCADNDLVVFSHLRWDFVYQRPQHLMTRFAKHRRLFFVEEPIFEKTHAPRLSITMKANQLFVVQPIAPSIVSQIELAKTLRALLDHLIVTMEIERPTLWYYTPMALPFSSHIEAKTIIYDCMDELSLFKGAHPDLLAFERSLFQKASVIFTGGQALYEE